MAATAKKEHRMSDLQPLACHDVPADQLSADVCSFLLRWTGPTLYAGRTKMGISIEGNGFESWRELFGEYEGCDKLTQVAGRSKLQ